MPTQRSERKGRTLRAWGPHGKPYCRRDAKEGARGSERKQDVVNLYLGTISWFQDNTGGIGNIFGPLLRPYGPYFHEGSLPRIG
jgi:hypothetical protein